MRVADTNVLVRVVMFDDPEQSPRARAVLSENEIFVPITVVLELDWVLRSRYRYGEKQAVDAIESLAGVESITFEHPNRVDMALKWARAGMDFADALHLAAAQEHDGLVTFDRDFTRIARREGVKTIDLL
jgi:predicted nucleic acid-binding protein